MTATSTTETLGPVILREAAPADAGACAQICFDAFAAVHDRHRFPRDFPELEAAAAIMDAWISHPSVWGVVAEVDGRIVGSNFLDERDPIRAVGPLTVDPAAQKAGVGRRLMVAVLERGAGAPGVRLTQDAFNMQSLALYESLGFAVREPLAVVAGTPSGRPGADGEVRALEDDDLGRCEALCLEVHGFTRTNELRDAARTLRPLVLVRGGRVTAYMSSPAFWALNHGVAESDEDMQALLIGAAAALDGPIELLVPLRGELFRWCLRAGMRPVKPVNLMALRAYPEPRAAWFPSVLY